MSTFLMNPTISPLSIYYVTINNKENAIKLSEILVQKKLVACVNIVGNNESPISSVFSWKGKQEIENEIFMIMKSRTNLLPEITQNVKENHPYDVPEVISTPIMGGSKDYIQWVYDQTKEPDQDIKI